MDSTTHATLTTDPRDKKKVYFADTPQRRALVGFARSVFQLVMELDVVGLENFPRRGAVILAANQVNNFDVVPIQLALPRPIFFMRKEFQREVAGAGSPTGNARRLCGGSKGV